MTLLPDDPHDAALLASARPPGWKNPDPAGLGARVALVEKHLLGGDCLNHGCVPSKALLRAARAAADVRDATRFGVRVPEGVRVDFGAVMERMRRLRASISPRDSAARFRDLGVDVFLGEARFAGPAEVEVGGASLRFRRACIATGARAALPSIPGLREAGFLTNETIFSLRELPRRIAVIGAGPIGCELAQAFRRFGSEVTLIQRGPRVLPREDPQASERLGRAFARDGIRLLAGATARAVAAAGSTRRIEVEREGRIEAVGADAILVAAGRAPNVDGLGLEAAGVAHDPRAGVRVDDSLRTTNPRIYAAGDVCSAFKFTHAADALARIVVRNALFLGRGRASALVIPWCTYTDPEVARVGLSGPEARERGIPAREFVQELRDVDRALLDGEEEGFAKVLVEEGTDRILGATLVARHAGETIPEIALAMTGGLGLKAISETIHPYPTQAEAIRRIGDAWNSSRLTPGVRRWLSRWLAWTR